MEEDIEIAAQAGPTLFKLLEGIIHGKPKSKKYLGLATNFCGMYSFGILEDQAEMLKTEESRDRVRALYKRGRLYGQRLLELSLPGFRESMRSGLDDFSLFLSAKAKKKHAKDMFWTSFCWIGETQNSLNNPDLIAELPLVKAIVDRAKELDPTIFWGGPDLFLGMYYGSRSPMLGGDPKKAEKHFVSAKSISGGRFLMISVLQARYWSTQNLDHKSFHTLLEDVLDADPENMPEQLLANKLAQRRAQRYLSMEDEWFDHDEELEYEREENNS